MSKKLLFFVGILFLFVSCEKSDDVAPPDYISAKAIDPYSIKINWRRSYEEDKITYLIEQKLDTESDAEFKNVGIGWNRYPMDSTNTYYEHIITGLAPGVKYNFRISSRKISGFNIYTSAQYASVTCTTKSIEIAPLANVTIGTQTWALKNLDVTKYKNGDVIPQITNINDWKAARSGAWCYYNFDSTNGAVYGKIYNQYAVDDPRGLAPIGWRIPTTNDFYALRDQLGGKNPAGKKMKSTTNWKTSSFPGSNSSGWTGLPGGRIYPGNTYAIDEYGYYWTSSDSTKYSTKSRNSVYLYYGTDDMYVDSDTSMIFGNYVRCIRN